MTEEIRPVTPLADVKGYEFRQFNPMQAEGIVDLFFGKGHPAMHDSYAIDGDNLSTLDSGPITDLIANGKMGMVDWNTNMSGGYVDFNKMPVFAIAAEGSTPVLMIGEKKDGKIAVVHRFWKERVETHS